MILEGVTRDLQWAGWLIVSQFVLLAVAVVHFEFGSPSLAATALALYCLAHLLASLLLGRAARQLGRSGLQYGLLALVAPLVGPLGALAWLSVLQRAGPGPAPLVTVGTFTGPVEANLARGRLEAEGIPAFLANEHHVWANWSVSQALGGIRLQVSPANVRAAESVLAEHLQGLNEALLADEFPGLENDTCPACGSTAIESRLPRGKLLLAMTAVGALSLGFPVRRERHSCLACGHRWRY